MGLFRKRREVMPRRLVRVDVLERQEIVGESRFQADIERFKLQWGRKVFAALWLSRDDPHALSPVQVFLASGDDFVKCGWIHERDASLWEGVILRAAANGEALFCDAEIRGGWESAPSYGVWLTPER